MGTENSGYPVASSMTTADQAYPMVGGTSQLLSNAMPVNQSDSETETLNTADQPGQMLGPPTSNPWAPAENPAARGPLDYPM